MCGSSNRLSVERLTRSVYAPSICSTFNLILTSENIPKAIQAYSAAHVRQGTNRNALEVRGFSSLAWMLAELQTAGRRYSHTKSTIDLDRLALLNLRKSGQEEASLHATNRKSSLQKRKQNKIAFKNDFALRKPEFRKRPCCFSNSKRRHAMLAEGNQFGSNFSSACSVSMCHGNQR